MPVYHVSTAKDTDFFVEQKYHFEVEEKKRPKQLQKRDNGYNLGLLPKQPSG